MKTVVGMLKTRDEAQFAIYDLVNCGVHNDAITLRSANVEHHVWSEEEETVVEQGAPHKGDGAGSSGIAYQVEVRSGRGDQAALTALGIPETDARYYSDGVARGGFLLTVVVGDALAEEVAEIIRRHGAIEDERGDSWRGQGWTRETGPFSAVGTVEAPLRHRLPPEKEPLSHATLQEQLERAELFGAGEPGGNVMQPRASEVQNSQEQELRLKEFREDKVQERELQPAGDAGSGAEPGQQVGVAAMDDETFERHFRATYGRRGERFEEPYRSAYHFAEAESSSHPQLVEKEWYEAEAEIHRDWEIAHPGTWGKVENAIHFGWDQTRRHH